MVFFILINQIYININFKYIYFIKNIKKNVNKKLSKYKFFYKISQFYYQNYFLILKNLCIIKKTIIINIYSIIIILKLKSNNRYNLKFY